MRDRRKIETIDKVLARWDEGTCLYCGSVLNGYLTNDDYDDMKSKTWCPNCAQDIDPYDDWDEVTVDAIRKIVNEEDFSP
jgi:hypothetical protein